MQLNASFDDEVTLGEKTTSKHDRKFIETSAFIKKRKKNRNNWCFKTWNN